MEIKREISYFKPFHWFAAIVVFTWILCIIVAGWWYLYPYNPVELQTERLEIVNTQVEAGSDVTYQANFVKNTEIKPHATYYLVDGTVTELKVSTTNRPEGENEVKRNVYIPVHTPPGIYHLQIELEYRVNPLRTVNAVWTSEDFEVLEYDGRDN